MAGSEHHVTFKYCQCEPLVVTMVRARLWPSTAQHPHLAFTFELLDWAEALLLECQVALKDLCKALSFRCPHLTSSKVNKNKINYNKDNFIIYFIEKGNLSFYD